MGDIASPKPIPQAQWTQGSLTSIQSILTDWALPLLTSAIFSGAALLFWVQPMMGKLVLPLLGGTPAVWTTALLFFQTALLAGYLYAHILGRYLSLRGQIAVHLGVLAISLLWLPTVIPADTVPASGEMPAIWLFGLLASVIGVPYTAVAATSPLLQRWLSMSSHASAANPYHLYAASNAGSLLGLLGYPLLVEPLAGASMQTQVWTAGFVLLLVLTGIAAAGLRAAATTAHASSSSAIHLTTFERFRWVALAFIPSSLLMGVTTHITTDIAAMPLLWAFPLALYLGTFIVAFSERARLPETWLLKAEALSIAVLAGMLWFDGSNAAGLATSLVGFFIIALARHSALSSIRPDASHLTEFYLWLSVGGALGGMFNAILAPELFSRITEYPLTIAAAAASRLLVPASGQRNAFRNTDLIFPGLVLVAAIAMHASGINANEVPVPVAVIAIAVMAFTAYASQTAAWAFALGIASMLLLLHGKSDTRTIVEARSFFGAYRIYTSNDGRHVILSHGTTIHGAQSVADGRPQPLTYYASEGPLGQAISAIRPWKPSLRYGDVGMGAGASACYSRPTDLWTFFEIDPLVVKLARDQGSFHFLKECTPSARVVTGDARLSLAREANQAFDVLIMDAFSSDSIPTHLMTREAMTLLRAKLAPGGVILFNISNRYLRLEPVVANTARAAGLQGIAQVFHASLRQQSDLVTSSHWIALSTDPSALQRIAETGNWHQLEPDPSASVWTDDYSSLLGVLAIK